MLRINRWGCDGYFLSWNEYNSDSEVASFLGLTTRQYRKILRKHGAKVIKNSNRENGDLLFETDEQSKNARRAFEPYIIMNKLVEG